MQTYLACHFDVPSMSLTTWSSRWTVKGGDEGSGYVPAVDVAGADFTVI